MFSADAPQSSHWTPAAVQQSVPYFDYLFVISLQVDDTDHRAEINNFPFIVLEQVLENGQLAVRVFEQQQMSVKSDWKVDPSSSLFPSAAAAHPNLMQCIRKFDAYVFTKVIQKNKSFCFVTDGPGDLLLTLRKEAMLKGIRLAAYYDRFFDVCKEFNKFYPEYGAKNMGDMCQCLGIARKAEPSGLDNCKSIANLVASMLREGYAFVEPEVIPVTFDPFAPFLPIPEAASSPPPPLSYKGAVSGQPRPSTTMSTTSSEVLAPDSSVVRLRGLPWDATPDDLKNFFSGLTMEDITWTFTHRNRPSGEAFVRFKTVEEAVKGLALHKQMLGKRYIEVFASTPAAQEAAKEAHHHQPLKRDDNLTAPPKDKNQKELMNESTMVMMYGLPYTVTVDEIEEFFQGYAFVPGSVEIDVDNSGKALGTGQVDFSKASEAKRAIQERNRKFIGKRYVNLHQNPQKKQQQLRQLMEQHRK